MLNISNFSKSDHWKNDHSMDITIEPSSSRDIFISFQHKGQIEELTKANLIVKPRGISQSDIKKTFKSTVQLQAFAWESFKLGVAIDDQPVTSVMQLEGEFLKNQLSQCTNIIYT